MQIGDRLREWGTEKFGNLTNLAKSMGMSQQTMSSYVNSKREPGAGILKKLNKLGCDINWLLTGDGQPLLERTSNTTVEPTMQQSPEMEQRLNQIESEIKDLAYKNFKQDQEIQSLKKKNSGLEAELTELKEFKDNCQGEISKILELHNISNAIINKVNLLFSRGSPMK